MFRGRQHSGSTGTPRKGKWRRRLLRAALGLVALLFLGCAFLFYGWRYGFRPLPEPLTGPEAARPALPALAEVGPGNYWYWPQALQKHIPTNAFEAEILIQTVQEWCRYGWVDQTNRVLLREWIKGQPALTEACQRALQTTNGLALFPWLRPKMPQWHESLLRAYAVWLALDAEQDGRIPEAMDRLVDAWLLEALSSPLNPSQQWNRPARIDQPWRRLVLSAADIPTDCWRKWLQHLGAIEQRLPPLAEAYEALAGDSTGEHWEMAVDPAPADIGLEELSAALRDVVVEMLDTGLENLTGTFERLLGREPASAPQGMRLNALANFVEGLTRVLAWRCSRPEDRRQVLEAIHTRTLQALRQGNSVEALHSIGGWEARWWDRPAAWAMRYYERGSSSVADRRQWLGPLRSCQLIVALRMFRNQSGHWPNTLAEATPFLAEPHPSDLKESATPTYRTDGEDWEIMALSRDEVVDWLRGTRILPAFHSRENEATFFRFAYGLLSNGMHRTNDWLLPALKRYGIVQGVESVTDAAPVITNLIFQIQEHRALGLAPGAGRSYGFPGWGLPSPRQVLPILQTMRVHPGSLTNLTLPVSSRFPSDEYDDRYLLQRKASPPPPPL